ncbi:glycosyltransferase family 4 protein [Fodinisporobacter ferrooxydans]|uniref:Glycosyltransferase family 4 protein n=1 Tax=Fodinisporobacter ferrooxydans TaxID=2901836 RepID=A0ABY4CLU6_9BACL|nr:glycosyltransferase family 4 protein [Alicyclobacillaceae bacterium MYW30-H2]
MKVFLDTTALRNGSEYRGIGRYIQVLLGLREQFNIDLITTDEIYPESPLNDIANEMSNTNLIKQYLKTKLPDPLLYPLRFMSSARHFKRTHYHPSYMAIPKDVDIIHAPANFFPYSLQDHPAKKVVSILDVIPFVENGRYVSEKITWFTKRSFQSVNFADMVITISEHSKLDIIKYLNVSPEKIVVTPLGFDPKLSKIVPSEEQINKIIQQYHLNEPYILYVGAIEKRKNINNLIRSFARLQDSNLKLILAGKTHEDFESFLRITLDLGIQNKVVFTGYVDDSVLTILYRKAKAFVFPTFYEGFGLPVLEAMSFGIPVMTSNTSSLPEVCEDAAILVDPHSIDSMVQGLMKLVYDENIREYCIKRGFERSQLFDWNIFFNKTLYTYRKIFNFNELI